NLSFSGRVQTSRIHLYPAFSIVRKERVMEQNPMSEQQGFHGTFSQLRQTVEGMLEEKQKTVEGMGELLAVKTKLLPYSMYTALAIHLQNPQAQYVAPYHEWRKMGYQVQ